MYQRKIFAGFDLKTCKMQELSTYTKNLSIFVQNVKSEKNEKNRSKGLQFVLRCGIIIVSKGQQQKTTKKGYNTMMNYKEEKIARQIASYCGEKIFEALKEMHTTEAEMWDMLPADFSEEIALIVCETVSAVRAERRNKKQG